VSGGSRSGGCSACDRGCGCGRCAECRGVGFGWFGAFRLVIIGIAWWLAGFLQLRRFIRTGRDFDASTRPRDPREPPCMPVPKDIWRRPDPTLYSQTFLMAAGLAVTWDNPDIHLEHNGSTVPSSDLIGGQEYDIVARIWNGSNDAPAVNLPVRFSYLDFGIGTVNVPIGWDKIDLPVNGAVGHPAIARQKWQAPTAGGHYCIQVEPVWPDDANPANNLGQENTNVKPLNSPRAVFTFPVRNDAELAQTLRLELDTYMLGRPRKCDDETPADTPEMTDAEIDRHRRQAIAKHGREANAVANGWQLSVEPSELRLERGESTDVTVDITAPDGFAGRQAVNVNALAGHRLVGGVTLYVDGTGD
jgi:hypothetical protein